MSTVRRRRTISSFGLWTYFVAEKFEHSAPYTRNVLTFRRAAGDKDLTSRHDLISTKGGRMIRLQSMFALYWKSMDLWMNTEGATRVVKVLTPNYR